MNKQNQISANTREKNRVGKNYHPLHEAALRITEIGNVQKRPKTKQLVGFLMSHGARMYRVSQPITKIHMNVVSANNSRSPIRLSLESQS